MSKHEPIFYACDNCHIIIEEINGTKEGFSCCGTQMEKLTPNTSEGAHEKHMPVVEQNGNTITVKVGSIFHPMSEEHSIEWIYLQTEKGGQRIQLVPDEEPVATFVVCDGDRALAAYAYCNLHGFWKVDI